jgi:hypothetical protein
MYIDASANRGGRGEDSRTAMSGILPGVLPVFLFILILISLFIHG